MKLEEIRGNPRIFDWGKKYYLEIFDSGEMYISYPKGHILISESQKKEIKSILNSIPDERIINMDTTRDDKGLLVTGVTSACPRLTRMCIRIIRDSFKEKGHFIRVRDKSFEDSVYLGDETYISKKDYNRVILHYEASKYGDL